MSDCQHRPPTCDAICGQIVVCLVGSNAPSQSIHQKSAWCEHPLPRASTRSRPCRIRRDPWHACSVLGLYYTVFHCISLYSTALEASEQHFRGCQHPPLLICCNAPTDDDPSGGHRHIPIRLPSLKNPLHFAHPSGSSQTSQTYIKDEIILESQSKIKVWLGPPMASHSTIWAVRQLIRESAGGSRAKIFTILFEIGLLSANHHHHPSS